MRPMLGVIAAGLWLVTAASIVHAHHSFAAEYDATKPITLKGEVQQVDMVNPHGWIHIKVTEPDGKIATWNVEMGSPSTLIRRGFSQDTVAKGTQVVVTGYRAKNGSRTVNGTNVTLPDGRRLFTGSSGTGAPVQ